jgi:hypothetical protein
VAEALLKIFFQHDYTPHKDAPDEKLEAAANFTRSIRNKP